MCSLRERRAERARMRRVCAIVTVGRDPQRFLFDALQPALQDARLARR